MHPSTSSSADARRAYLDDWSQRAVRLEAVLVGARAVAEQQVDARLAVPLVQQTVVEVVVRVDDAVERSGHAADKAAQQNRTEW